MPEELIDILCKIVEQISDNCNTCGDCDNCLYNGVLCSDERNQYTGFALLPEDWDYELLRKRLRGEKE